MGEVEMQSLALLVTILVSITVFSAPISILLSSRKAQSLTNNQIAKILRRTIMALISAVGSLVSLFFIMSPIPFLLKFISMAALLINVWSVDREYGGRLMTRFKVIFGKSA
jgi:ABC-type phosphate/phosphonate transport system permease subunit